MIFVATACLSCTAMGWNRIRSNSDLLSSRRSTTCCLRAIALRAFFAELHKPSRHRIFRVGVIVEALARFAAVPARQHQSPQQRRRGEARLLEFVELIG